MAKSNPVYGGDSLAQGGGQTAHRTSEESFTIDSSQSINQILASLGHKPNTNPKEGFDLASACTDAWRMASSEWNKKQEDRILGLELQLSTVNNLCMERIAALSRKTSGRILKTEQKGFTI